MLSKRVYPEYDPRFAARYFAGWFSYADPSASGDPAA